MPAVSETLWDKYLELIFWEFLIEGGIDPSVAKDNNKPLQKTTIEIGGVLHEATIYTN